MIMLRLQAVSIVSITYRHNCHKIQVEQKMKDTQIKKRLLTINHFEVVVKYFKEVNLTIT